MILENIFLIRNIGWNNVNYNHQIFFSSSHKKTSYGIMLQFNVFKVYLMNFSLTKLDNK